MKFDQLKSSLSEQIFPIYLLEGEEIFFRERGEALIKKLALQEPSLNYARFEGSLLKQSTDPLVDALACCPFMSEKRVVTVLEWYPTAQELKNKALKSYLDAPFDTSVLIILNSKKCEALKKCPSVTLVDCSKGDDALIGKYVRAKASKAGLIVNQNVVKKIIEFCAYDMTRIDSETDKLISYALESVEITEQDVEKMVAKSTDYQIYQMVSFIADKNYGEAYKILNALTDSGDKQMLFVSLYYHFRRMFFAAVSTDSDAVLADKMGVKEYAIKMARRQAKSFSPKRLKKIMDRLSQNDADFKSGKITFDGAFLTGVFTVLTEE